MYVLFLFRLNITSICSMFFFPFISFQSLPPNKQSNKQSMKMRVSSLLLFYCRLIFTAPECLWLHLYIRKTQFSLLHDTELCRYIHHFFDKRFNRRVKISAQNRFSYSSNRENKEGYKFNEY